MDRRSLLAALAAGALAGCAATPPSPLREGQQPQSRSLRIDWPTTTETLRYQLFLPRGYEADATRRWPALLFLHGSGEAGNDLERVKVHGPPKIADRDPDFPFIVISPQLEAPGRGFVLWQPTVLHALMEQLKRELRIDADRVSVTGLSLGGGGAWAYAAAYPQDLAAAAPVCGFGDPRQICGAGKLPIWAFHGAKDDVVPPAASQALVDALQACGGNVQLTIYPGVGHNAWDPAYDDPALYRWLLAQRRSVR